MKSLSFLRRPAGASDPISDETPLHDRVQVARDRLAHQHDPALLEALSERELNADRALAERARDHERNEKLARIEAAEKAADRLRRTIDELADQQSRDLIDAERAIAQQRHSSSPHTKVARLHRRKTLALRIVTSVLIIAMAISAVSVQHNIAPTGGPSNIWWWMAYGIEFLISGTLIALMMSTGDSAEWGVIEQPWKARGIENVLLGVTVVLNVFPYLENMEWGQIGAHIIAPVIIGTALHTYSVVATRYSRSIDRATESLSEAEHEDIQARLAALTRIGPAVRGEEVATTGVAPGVRNGDNTDVEAGAGTGTYSASARPPLPSVSPVADEVFEELEREFAARGQTGSALPPIAREPIAARADQAAIETARGRAPIARGESAEPRADVAPIAVEDASPIARGARPERDEGAVRSESIARAEAADEDVPRAVHNPAEQATDREPIAAREDETSSADEGSDERATRDRRSVVTLVRGAEPARAAIGNTDRSPRAGRAPRARETAVDGALARATDRAPIARGTVGSGPFAHRMTRAEAGKLARAVASRGLSKQPVEVLTLIYEAHSRGESATGIAEKVVALPHSTVLRAIKAADKVAGPRSIG
ncbi:hypothetical protein AB0H49_34070 [Nocardia sp. NPDC050713]|uniref:hypothetical protein n=1 Tax=Nocardia sp. NPDC050713 TaxID=3154511 RepID=UPI003405B127